MAESKVCKEIRLQLSWQIMETLSKANETFKDIQQEYSINLGKNIDNNTVTKRIDFVFISKEKVSFGYEIKCSEQDINTGYGMNFYAMYNFLIVPGNIYHLAEAKLHDMKRDDVGIGLFSEGDNVIYFVRPSRLNHEVHETLDKYKGGEWDGICNDVLSPFRTYDTLFKNNY